MFNQTLLNAMLLSRRFSIRSLHLHQTNLSYGYLSAVKPFALSENRRNFANLTVDRIAINKEENDNERNDSSTVVRAETEIVHILSKIIAQQNSKPLPPIEDGLCLLSDYGLQIVSAYKNAVNTTVEKVPFHYREGNHVQLRKCLERERTINRVHLLCTGAYQGSGKTVQQVINLKEFVEETKGISIEITYNDDQMDLWGLFPKDSTEFAQGFALRVFHRILGIHLDNDTAKSTIIGNKTLHDTIKLLEDPLRSALRIAREMLGIPVGTKIMLGIDELKKVDKTHISHREILSVLCGRMDADDSLYLSVAAYGCIDIADFATGSNRALLFQPLGPLMLEVSEEMWTQLPAILQFFIEE